jgi:hypothetical protein
MPSRIKRPIETKNATASANATATPEERRQEFQLQRGNATQKSTNRSKSLRRPPKSDRQHRDFDQTRETRLKETFIALNAHRTRSFSPDMIINAPLCTAATTTLSKKSSKHTNNHKQARKEHGK